MLSVLGRFANRRWGDDSVAIDVLTAVLNVDREFSLPTLFTTWLLLFAGVVAATCAASQRSIGWASLALLLCASAFDELLSFHEQTMGPVRDALEIESGPLYFAWVVIAIPLIIAGALVFRPFVRSLPGPVRTLLILGFFLAALGAVGFEMIGATYATSVGVEQASQDGVMWAIVTLEETLEMVGAATILSGVTLARNPVAERGGLEKIEIIEQFQ